MSNGEPKSFTDCDGITWTYYNGLLSGKDRRGKAWSAPWAASEIEEIARLIRDEDKPAKAKDILDAITERLPRASWRFAITPASELHTSYEEAERECARRSADLDSDEPHHAVCIAVMVAKTTTLVSTADEFFKDSNG
jgi:hypothetical protein